MSDDLVEFVRQCVARDEQVARAAGADSLEWREDSSWLHDLRDPLPSQRRDHELAPGTKLVSDADAAHIARHDPARVLAEVEAKRAIVDQHRPSVERKSWDEDWTICGTCRYDCGLDTYPFPCPTLRALAQPYAGEPGWQEEWRL